MGSKICPKHGQQTLSGAGARETAVCRSLIVPQAGSARTQMEIIAAAEEPASYQYPMCSRSMRALSSTLLTGLLVGDAKLVGPPHDTHARARATHYSHAAKHYPHGADETAFYTRLSIPQLLTYFHGSTGQHG